MQDWFRVHITICDFSAFVTLSAWLREVAHPPGGLLARMMGVSSWAGCFVSPGGFGKELPMDSQTVIAVCEILLVFIGIVGLVLMMRG